MAVTRSVLVFFVLQRGVFGFGDGSTSSDIAHLRNTLETMQMKLEKVDSKLVTVNQGLQRLQQKMNGLTRCQAPFVLMGGQCYLFSYMKKSWSDAQAYCRSMSSHLATITSWSENNIIAIYIQNNFPDNFSWWIGGNDMASEGRWVWVENNRRVSYFNWAPREPNNGAGHNEDCMEFFYDQKPKWNDHMCHEALHFICEK